MKQELVHLFVLDTMADWEAAYAVAAINKPDYQKQPGRLRVATVGPDRSVIRTMGGVRIVPDTTLADLRPQDSALLILPGADAWDHGEHDEAVQKAREFLDAGVPVAAICGATAGLARNGLLDARPHTSNAPEYLDALPGYAGQAYYVNEPAVRDGDLITASGVAPVHFARLIFERLDVYDAPVLEAWFTLYTTRDPSAFYALLEDAG
jgi:putative intracellular protease/amidase